MDDSTGLGWLVLKAQLLRMRVLIWRLKREQSRLKAVVEELEVLVERQRWRLNSHGKHPPSGSHSVIPLHPVEDRSQQD